MKLSNETLSLGFVVGEVFVLMNVLALSQLSPLSDLKGFTEGLPANSNRYWVCPKNKAEAAE